MARCRIFSCTCPEELFDFNHKSPMPHIDVDSIRNLNDFPSTWRISLPDSSCPSPSHAPSDAFAMFVSSLELGVRFPLPPFAMKFLSENKLVPAQLQSKGWAHLMGFHVRCVQKGIEPSTNLLFCFFHTHGGLDSITLRKSSGIHSIYSDDFPKSKSKSIDPWFLVHPPASSWDAPLGWCHHRVDESKLSRKDIRKVFMDQISTMIAGNEIALSTLLEPQNLAAAGWCTNSNFLPTNDPLHTPYQVEVGNRGNTTSASCIVVSPKEPSRGDISIPSVDPSTCPLNEVNFIHLLGPELPSLEDNFFDDILSVSSNPLDGFLDDFSENPITYVEGGLGDISSLWHFRCMHRCSVFNLYDYNAFLLLLSCAESNPFKEAMRVKRRKLDRPSNLPPTNELPRAPPKRAKDKGRDIAEKPTRPGRRVLRFEKHRPITLPKVDDTLPPWNDGEGRTFQGSEFTTRAGFLDTDSVGMRGVAPRLVLSMILPRDEDSLFGPSEDCFDSAETGALKVICCYLAYSYLTLPFLYIYIFLFF